MADLPFKLHGQTDEEKLRTLFAILKQHSLNRNVDLKWVEMKGSVYFFPQLMVSEVSENEE